MNTLKFPYKLNFSNKTVYFLSSNTWKASVKEKERQFVLSSEVHYQNEQKALVLESREEFETLEDTAYYVITDQQHGLYFSFVLPDKSLFVKLATPLRVLPRAELSFYVKIPLWANFSTSPSVQDTVKSFALQRMTKSWTGSTASGTICYTAYSDIVLKADNEPFYTAYCPVTLKNQSKEPCEITYIILEALNLALYQEEGRFFTDEIKLFYYNKERIDRVFVSHSQSFSKKLHKETRLVHNPREKVSKNLLKNSFNFLVDISRMQ